MDLVAANGGADPRRATKQRGRTTAREHAAKNDERQGQHPDAELRGRRYPVRLPYVVAEASRFCAPRSSEGWPRSSASSAGGAKVLSGRQGGACAEIAPYASPSTHARLEGLRAPGRPGDIAARSSEFLANPDPEASLRVRPMRSCTGLT